METIKRISDTQLEITKVTEETEVVNIDKLLYEKDSLQRTIVLNNEENDARNAEILEQINKINEKITLLK